MKKYAIIKDKKVVYRKKGVYTDDYAEVRKHAPCIIIQRGDIPDDEPTHNKSQRIRIDKSTSARLRLLVPLLAYLAIGCTGTPHSTEIQPLETGICLEDTTPIDPIPSTASIDLEQEWEAVSRLAHAFALVESGDNPHAINHKENAVGLLQIRPIMVRQANQIVGEDIYTLADRHDSLTSIAIFHTVMAELNPSLDIDRAINIWNPNCNNHYRNLIKSIYHE